MSDTGYRYSIDDCKFDEKTKKRVSEYRKFRDACLERIYGDSGTSIANQVHDLAWHTAVFRTLNEARRLEPDRGVNGPMWELIVAGYANIMTLGIRKLVDRDPQTDSVWNLIKRVEKRPELLTRELFICYDALPYDFEVVRDRLKAQEEVPSGTIRWLSNFGPDAWSTSKRMHEVFDTLCGNPQKQKRGDTIELALFEALREALKSPCITRVQTLASKSMAHAERLSESSGAIPNVTYEDVDEALKIIISVTNWIATNVFYDNAFGTIVATTTFDPLEHLDSPWVTSKHLPNLRQHWREISKTMDSWADADPFVSRT